ncbi:MAG: hypothetical protein ABSA68_19745 [Xanthobacteraceae bacterium]
MTSLIGVASLENDRGPAERSVTTFTLVQRQKCSLFFCIAKCRSWPVTSLAVMQQFGSDPGFGPLSSDITAQANVGFRGQS